jgi:hypothetical protein
MRRRARYVAFTVTGAALIVGGIVGALVSPRAESRIFGVAVLAFGAAGVAAGRMYAPGRAHVPPRTTRTEVHGRAVAAVELELGRDRLRAAVAGAAAFAVAGVAMALATSRSRSTSSTRTPRPSSTRWPAWRRTPPRGGASRPASSAGRSAPTRT